MPDEAPPSSTAPPRLAALDVYRGFVMFLMAAELLEVPQVARAFPQSVLWQFLKQHSTHVAWTGCSLHDLIQPSFSFLVGAALPFSIASRMTKEQSTAQMWMHALWRSLLLILLGVFLRSMGASMTNWTFEDTLTQIGLGYPFLFLLGFAGNKTRWISLALILVAYWLAFACFRLPPTDFDYAATHVAKAWTHHFEGFAAHWNINSNVAWAFDSWFLNLFPRENVFTGNDGGYSTLSFIPTLGTMILGLIAGEWLKLGNKQAPASETGLKKADENFQSSKSAKARLAAKLLTTGLAFLATGWLFHVTGICPVVKKIWTPSWTLFSGGWCFMILALFYFITEVRGWRRWAFPLRVIGMNSIAMYVMVHTIAEFVGEALHTHFGHAPFQVLGQALEPMLHGACVLTLLWFILLWMQRHKIFLRV